MIKTIVRKLIVVIAFGGMLMTFTNCTSLLKEVSQVTVVVYTKEGKKIEVLSTKEKGEISQLKTFVTSKKAPLYKCSYNGEITFYTEKGTISGEYNHSAGCGHIVFLINGELVSRRLSKEGLNYLKKLADKASEKVGFLDNKPQLAVFKYYGEPLMVTN